MRTKIDNSAATAATNVSSSPPAAAGGPAPCLEDVIARFAARQHGMITRTQLLTAGIAPQVVQRRINARRLRPIHRGVYLASSHMTGRARELAAVLACGRASALSHLSAAVFWTLGRVRSESARMTCPHMVLSGAVAPASDRIACAAWTPTR